MDGLPGDGGSAEHAKHGAFFFFENMRGKIREGKAVRGGVAREEDGIGKMGCVGLFTNEITERCTNEVEVIYGGASEFEEVCEFGVDALA